MKLFNLILEIAMSALIVTSPYWFIYYFKYVLNY